MRKRPAPRKMPDIPRVEWPDRLLLALVEEYSKPPESIGVDLRYGERFGVSPRRLGVAAGLLPADGINPETEMAWLQEINQAEQDLVAAGLAEYFADWVAFRPTRQGIEHARRLKTLGMTDASAATSKKPSVFLGSSSEALPVLTALTQNLDRSALCKPWTTIFAPSRTTMEDLVAKLPTYDFAVFVLQADDLRAQETRDRKSMVPRDNVIFELGLAIGFLGRPRVFMVVERGVSVELPTDLAGVTPITYEPHPDGDLKAALFSAAAEIQQAIQREMKS